MGMEPNCRESCHQSSRAVSPAWGWLTALAIVVGLLLAVDTIFKSSATYDEVAYLKVGARWWRTGDQFQITRMGSPVTFWKLQQAPTLWLLDHIGCREWIDQPTVYQRRLLPAIRLGSLWIWLAALGLTLAWARQSHGPRAMAMAAWIFALSPNLIAHGTLATMELPLVTATAAMFWFFWRFLDSKKRPWFWASAAAAGLAFSCKFTAIVFPPIIACVWWLVRWRDGEKRLIPLFWQVGSRMFAYVLLLLLSNIALTAFARIPLSTTHGQHPSLARWVGARAAVELSRLYETPLPQDWVGFATQMHHQASGGFSYLWGERRIHGWWYYYFVALAVKVPLGFWVLVIARLAFVRVPGNNRDAESFPPLGGKDGHAPHTVPTMRGESLTNLIPIVFVLFLAMMAIGSSRNYGIRYLLPLAPLAIVWVSAVAESRRPIWPRCAVAVSLAGLVAAVAASHPYELTYFNLLAGGPEGGRHILADSNLDWGQGLEAMARLQRERPELRNITFYYFGDTDPTYYGVAGRCHVVNAVDDHSRLPGLDQTETPYLAVSASLQFGPWGPPGFFRDLDRLRPLRYTADTTIAIYRTADLKDVLAAHQ